MFIPTPITNMGNKTNMIGIEQLGLGPRVGKAFHEAYDWMEESENMD